MAFAAEALPYLQYAGMALSAYSSVKGSQANKDAANGQAAVNENNARIAEAQAEDAIARGRTASTNQGIRTNQQKGTQRASLAANGVDLGVGSALNILADTQYFGDVDRDTIVENADKEAWALRNQASNFASDATLLRNRADMESPLLAGSTSLLTSAGKVADRWYASGAGTPKAA